eukprot:499560-Hanusia_phi.AAC.5
MLYVPAGYASCTSPLASCASHRCDSFPHVTDTVNGVTTQEESIHLTLGVDTSALARRRGEELKC